MTWPAWEILLHVPLISLARAGLAHAADVPLTDTYLPVDADPLVRNARQQLGLPVADVPARGVATQVSTPSIASVSTSSRIGRALGTPADFQNLTLALVDAEFKELELKRVNLHRFIAQRRMEAHGKSKQDGPVKIELHFIYFLYALLFLCVCSYLVNECCTYRERQMRSAQAAASGVSAPDTDIAPRQEIVAPFLGLGVGHDAGVDIQGDTAEANRLRFQAHRELIATQMLMRALPIFIVLLMLALALFICDVTIVFVGWMVYFNHKDQPCDQPLQWWLLAAMLIQFGQHLFERAIESRQNLQKLNLIVMPVMLSVGTYMYVSAQTCGDTNPQLYHFVFLFFICQFLKWLYMMFTVFLLLGLIVWMAHRGLLDDGNASAAGPEFIHKLDTVPFSADDPTLHEDDDSKQPRECCICQQKFDAEKPIKRTPCKHLFHEECLGDWLGRFSRTCPLCRLDLDFALSGAAAEANHCSSELSP